MTEKRDPSDSRHRPLSFREWLFQPVLLQADLNHAQLLEILMTTQAETATLLNALADQLGKVFTEINTAMGELRTAIEAAGNATPDMQAALGRLTVASQKLDDLVPDPVVVEPTPTEPTPGEPTTGGDGGATDTATDTTGLDTLS